MDRRSALRSLPWIAALLVSGRAPAATTPRVVFLLWGSEPIGRPFVESFREGLREAGHVEGRTLTLDVRFNPSDRANLDAVMRQAVRERPDVLVVAGLAAARRARELTTTIPVVVATASDLVDGGVVASYARPGATSPALRTSPTKGRPSGWS
jgi:putative ABC transport system substrate-binding protein